MSRRRRGIGPALLAGLLVACTLGATAQEAAPAPAPFLWRIQGAHATHYLLGSVHLLPERAGRVPPALEDAFRDAPGGIVLETDLGALMSPDALMKMATAGQSPPPGLRGELGDALYQKVRKGLTASGETESLCDSLRAWLCALTLELKELQGAGFKDSYGLDEHFYAEAQALHRRVDWFEAVEHHLGFFTDMPEPMARQYLLGTLDPTQRADESPEETLRMWRSNDLAAMTKAVGDFSQRFPDLYDYLIAARNRAWQPKLAALLDDPQGHLIVVGVAHCVGPQGLVSLLAARGVHVSPVAAGTAAAMRRTLPTDAS